MAESNADLEDAREFVHKVLKVQQFAENTQCKVTISFHRVTAYQTDQLERRTEEKYIICAIGEEPDLSLPTRFVYHDPRHKWVCVTWSEDNSMMMEKLTEFWPKDPQKSRQLAKHAVYKCTDEDPRQLLHIDGSSTDVRYSAEEKKNSHHMATWSHERNANSLADTIKKDQAFSRELCAKRKQLLTACTQTIKDKWRGFKSQCVKLCHCKQNQNDREHHNSVLNVKLRDETQSTSQAEGKQNQTISTHIVFTTPPPKDLLTKMNMDPILSAELRSMLDNHSEKVCKLINEYITKNLLDHLPTSFEFPTSQLCLKKLAYPNQMGPQCSPQILFLQRCSEAHFRFSKPQTAPNREVNAAEAEELVSKLLQN